jgi:hypothetical protein
LQTYQPISTLETAAQLALLAAVLGTVSLVPLAVGLSAEVELPAALRPLFGMAQASDLFMRVKASVVQLLGAAAGLALAIFGVNRLARTAAPLLAMALLLSGQIGLSAALAEHAELALRGSPGQPQGSFVFLAYLLLTLAAAAVLDTERRRIATWAAAGAAGCVASLTGLAELAGLAPFESQAFLDWSRALVPGLDALTIQLNPRVGPHVASATLGNPNFAGMYAAMLWPAILALALTAASRRTRWGWSIAALMLHGLLAASLSRTGLAVGILASLAALALVWRTRTVRGSRLAAFVAAHVAIFALIATLTPRSPLDHYARGAAQPLASSGSAARSPLWLEGDRLHLALNEPELVIGMVGSQIAFYDSKGRMLALKEGLAGAELADARFRAYQLSASRFRDFGVLEIMQPGQRSPLAVVPTPQGLRVLVRGSLLKPTPGRYAPLPLSHAALTGRGMIWAATLPLIADRWLVGHGPGHFVLDYPNRDFGKLMQKYGTPEIVVDMPHNAYLQWAYMFGLPSLVCLLALFAATLRRLWRAQAVAPLVATASFLACALMNDAVVSVAPVFWVILGMGWSYRLERPALS